MSEIPAHIQPYVDALGNEDVAIEFFLTFGGAPLHLTERPSPKSRLVAAIGMAKAKALGHRFGAGYVRVPVAKKWIAQHLRAGGTGVFEIARRLHVTDATVRGYLRPADQQLDLF